MRKYLPYLLVLLLIAAILRVDFYFTIVYLFLAVYVVSQIWTRHSMEQLHIERQFPGRAFAGDSVTASLMVHNQSWVT